jgi:hypothetical protein
MGLRDLHRIGGASVTSLRLKSREAALNPPGISVLRATTPGDAARQIRAAFPIATVLHQEARTVASASEESIRQAGFDVVAAPTRMLPNHYRIVHPDGASGFNDTNLSKLVAAFTTTTGH